MLWPQHCQGHRGGAAARTSRRTYARGSPASPSRSWPDCCGDLRPARQGAGPPPVRPRRNPVPGAVPGGRGLPQLGQDRPARHRHVPRQALERFAATAPRAAQRARSHAGPTSSGSSTTATAHPPHRRGPDRMAHRGLAAQHRQLGVLIIRRPGVCPAACRAHGTAATTTACTGQFTRGVCLPHRLDRARQRRRPCPWLAPCSACRTARSPAVGSRTAPREPPDAARLRRGRCSHCKAARFPVAQPTNWRCQAVPPVNLPFLTRSKP